jgi:hypothetical protein
MLRANALAQAASGVAFHRCYQFTQSDFKSLGNSRHVNQCDIAFTAFNVPDVCTVNLGQLGQLFLRDSLRKAQLPHRLPECKSLVALFVPSHWRQRKRKMVMSLQTISGCKASQLNWLSTVRTRDSCHVATCGTSPTAKSCLHRIGTLSLSEPQLSGELSLSSYRGVHLNERSIAFTNRIRDSPSPSRRCSGGISFGEENRLMSV